MRALASAFLRLHLFLAVAFLRDQPARALEGRIRLEESGLVLSLPDGRVLSRDGLIGMTLILNGGGTDLEVRIDGFEEDRPSARAPIPLYRMTLRQPDGTRTDLCREDPAGRRAAFAVPDGRGGFNLTCTSGAEGKCVLFGYRPWEAQAAVPMRDLLQACIHLLRADYGGDDRPTTRNGTTIDLYDRFGIQNPGGASGMAFEAAWGADGAVCVAHPRIADNVTLAHLAERYPRLRGRLGPEACTEHAMRADPRALIFNRSAVTDRAPE